MEVTCIQLLFAGDSGLLLSGACSLGTTCTYMYTYMCMYMVYTLYTGGTEMLGPGSTCMYMYNVHECMCMCT